MNKSPDKILVIQTAFIGDAILTTSLVEKLSSYFPNATIDMLVRKGSEILLKNHPIINEIRVWNKKKKYRDAFRLIGELRKARYDVVINAQRHFTTGIMTAFSGAQYKIGFKSNPMSGFFDEKHPFEISRDEAIHETDRLHILIAGLTDANPGIPKLYPGEEARKSIAKYTGEAFITIHPGSVWATKQLPESKWIDLIGQLQKDINIYLLGGPGEIELCERIRNASSRNNVYNRAGEINLIETAALMQHAVVNYVNDSAPLHICTAVDAPVIAVFCSTIPEFGFYPKSSKSKVVEIKENLYCRPCGVHGKKKCPEGHFKCGNDVDINDLLPVEFLGG